jgi:hypothetical protein
VSLTPRLFYLLVKSPLFPLNRRLVGPRRTYHWDVGRPGRRKLLYRLRHVAPLVSALRAEILLENWTANPPLFSTEWMVGVEQCLNSCTGNAIA